MNRKSKTHQRGIIIVLAALMVAVFVGLCALVIGLGILATNKSRMQLLANAASLAALEKWVATSEKSTDERITLLLDRANDILALNQPMPSLKDSQAGLGTIHLEGEDIEIGSNPAGTLRLGIFYARNPEEDASDPNASGDGPCGNKENYPCLQWYPGQPQDTELVNAIQLDLKAGASNPILAPFTSIFGSDLFEVEVQSTATLVIRCTAFLLDVSLSAYADTHNSRIVSARKFEGPPYPPAPAPAVVIYDPIIPSLYAYRKSSVDGEGSSWFCNDYDDLNVSEQWKKTERRAWCNMRPARDNNWAPFPFNGEDLFDGSGFDLVGSPPASPSPFTLPVADPSNGSDPNYSRFHYRNDYKEEDSLGIDELILIDKFQNVDAGYEGPQPFVTYLKAINTGLRTLEAQQTPFDLVTLKAFTGVKVNEVPPPLDSSGGPSPYPKLWNNLGYMTQLSDYTSIGTCAGSGGSEICELAEEPNFVSHGWFSVIPNDEQESAEEDSATNLVEILDDTIAQLETSCPVNSKKQIILFTDGISTCSFQTHDDSGQRVAIGDDPDAYAAYRSCGSDYTIYTDAERQLIGMVGGVPYDRPVTAGLIPYPSILERLQNSEIALTSIVSGSYIGPNFMNVNREPADPNAESAFLSYLEALSLGFSSFNEGGCPADYTDNGGSCNFFNVASSCPPSELCTDDKAFSNAGNPSYVFRRPNGVLGRLSLKSGGLWCPLMDRMPDADPSCSPKYEAGKLNDACRTPGQSQVYSTLDLSKSEMAAQCASQAVGYNPYVLSEPKYVMQAPEPVS